jgi:solute carrier family 8 (sodium/calcium exchanger)
MEKEGLERGIKYLESQELEVGLLVTDRHSQISKWVRENMPDTTHRYDIWHVAKGIYNTTMLLIYWNF